jgi:hypothetical protein
MQLSLNEQEHLQHQQAPIQLLQASTVQQQGLVAVATSAWHAHKLLSEVLSSCPKCFQGGTVALPSSFSGSPAAGGAADAAAVALAAGGACKAASPASGPESLLWSELAKVSAKALGLVVQALRITLKVQRQAQEQQEQQQDEAVWGSMGPDQQLDKAVWGSTGSGQQLDKAVWGSTGPEELRVLLQPLLVAVADVAERKAAAVAAMKAIRGEFGRTAWLQALRAAEGDELNGVRLVLAMQVSLGMIMT